MIREQGKKGCSPISLTFHSSMYPPTSPKATELVIGSSNCLPHQIWHQGFFLHSHCSAYSSVIIIDFDDFLFFLNRLPCATRIPSYALLPGEKKKVRRKHHFSKMKPEWTQSVLLKKLSHDVYSPGLAPTQYEKVQNISATRAEQSITRSTYKASLPWP